MGVLQLNDHILKDFLTESFKNLTLVEYELVQYKKSPNERELINSIYRRIHTLKGSSSLLGFKTLETTSHILETLLDKARAGNIRDHKKLVDILIKTNDVLFDMTKTIEQTGKEAENDHKDIAIEITSFMENQFIGKKSVCDGERIIEHIGTLRPYPRKEKSKLLCTFKIGRNVYAIPALQVQEISTAYSVTPIPLTPDYINGLINLRGRVVIDIGFRTLIRMNKVSKKERTGIVVNTKKSLYSLEVDEVLDVVEVQESMREEMPSTIEQRIKHFLDGVYKLNDKLLMTLNVDKVLNL